MSQSAAVSKSRNPGKPKNHQFLSFQFAVYTMTDSLQMLIAEREVDSTHDVLLFEEHDAFTFDQFPIQ